MPLLDTALKAAEAVGIPRESIFIMPMAGYEKKSPFASVDDLVEEGKRLPPVETITWIQGQGARQVAYLCYSSGTSGLPVSIDGATRLMFPHGNS